MMKKKITYGDKYGPAMKITDQKLADQYFEECVEHNMTFGNSREKAEDNERQNLGYWAGYYDHETRLRVEKLFGCKHPVFGSAEDGKPTPGEAFEVGKKIGAELAN